MIQYKQVKFNDEIQNNCILKIVDGAIWSIPNDPNNRDWVGYQEWLAQGNEPEPAD